jgi:hypothetical protein
VVWSIFGRIVENVGEEEANGNSELVATDDGTTDPLGGALGLIHRDQSGDQTDTEAGKHTTDDEERKVSGCGLESDTDGEDKTRSNDAPFSAKGVTTGGGK